jgi:hypothetical protein
MIRPLLTAMIYLGAAQILEMALLPPFQEALPDPVAFVLDWRLLALGGILAGMLRGELQGMLVAWVAAALFGFALPPGRLGAALVSYSIAAYVSGSLARHLRLHSFGGRWSLITLILIGERMASIGLRWMIWPTLRINIPWLSLILTGLIGAAIYNALAPKLRRPLGY